VISEVLASSVHLESLKGEPVISVSGFWGQTSMVNRCLDPAATAQVQGEILTFPIVLLVAGVGFLWYYTTQSKSIAEPTSLYPAEVIYRGPTSLPDRKPRKPRPSIHDLESRVRGGCDISAPATHLLEQW